MNYQQKYLKYKSKYIKLKYGGTLDVEYPYYNLFYTFNKDKFEQLVNNFSPKIINQIPEKMRREHIEKYKNEYVLIQEDWDKNEELNNVTDYFTEMCRVKCKFAKFDTPYDFWQKNKSRLLNESMQKFNKLNIKYIRDQIYYKTRLCNNFRISVAITILRLFNAKKWLDISAGWGDRLIAAIAHNVELYCGVDPNECLHPGYSNIINTLVSENKRDNYILIKDGFETAQLPNTKFDLVFSSPPFFDLEVYSKFDNDSLVKYKSVDKWYNEFLLVSVKKAYDYLENGGHMVLYMGEGIGTKYIGDMINEINKIMNYEGKIYYFYTDKYQPKRFYIWKKNN